MSIFAWARRQRLVDILELREHRLAVRRESLAHLVGERVLGALAHELTDQRLVDRVDAVPRSHLAQTIAHCLRPLQRSGRESERVTLQLRELLTEYRLRARFTEPDDYVFATGTGGRTNASNVRNRLLAPAVKLANTRLVEAGSQPIDGATPHSLRRTAITLALAAGADVRTVMGQVGHTDPTMTLGISAQVLRTGSDYGSRVDALVKGAQLAQMAQAAVWAT